MARRVSVDASVSRATPTRSGSRSATTTARARSSSTRSSSSTRRTSAGVPLEFGGAPNYFGGGIAVDASGNAYVVGDTDSSDMPSFSGTPAGMTGRNVFVAKVNPTGSTLAVRRLPRWVGHRRRRRDRAGRVRKRVGGRPDAVDESAAANGERPRAEQQQGLGRRVRRAIHVGRHAQLRVVRRRHRVRHRSRPSRRRATGPCSQAARAPRIQFPNHGSDGRQVRRSPATTSTRSSSSSTRRLSTASGLVYGSYFGGSGTCNAPTGRLRLRAGRRRRQPAAASCCPARRSPELPVTSRCAPTDAQHGPDASSSRGSQRPAR